MNNAIVAYSERSAFDRAGQPTPLPQRIKDEKDIEPYERFEMQDEIQDQIVAGNLTGTNPVTPTGPGYLAWLNSKGFPTDMNQYPIVDVVDDGIDQGARHGLVDEQRFFRLQHGDSLLEMNATVNAFQQHHIHFLQQLGNGIDDLDPHLAQVIGKPGHSVAAGGNVGAAGISNDNLDSGHVASGLGAIEYFRERWHVRGIKANHPGANCRRGSILGLANMEEEQAGKRRNELFHNFFGFGYRSSGWTIRVVCRG